MDRSVRNSEISLYCIERGSVRFVCNAATCFLRGKLNLINSVLWKLECVRHGAGRGRHVGAGDGSPPGSLRLLLKVKISHQHY